MVSKHWLVLTWVCVIVSATAGCTRQKSRTAKVLTTPTKALAPQLDTDYFRPIGLEPYFSYDLSLKGAERIEQVWLTPKSIYCLTSENILHRLDREKVTSWQRQPAAPPRVIRRPVEVDGKTLVVVHNIAKIYQAQTGEPLKEMPLEFGANSDPAFDGKVLYIADSRGRVRAVELDSGMEIWTCRAEKSISARPVLLGRTLVSASESGEVLAYDTTSYELLWPDHFRTKGAILTRPVLTSEGRCYVVGADSTLYCLRIGSGDRLWRYFAGTSLATAPAVADGRVFLNVPGKGLVVLDARNGQELEGFSFPQGRRYLGRVDDRLYIATADRRVISVDFHSGEQLSQIELKDFDVFLTNEKEGQIFVLNRQGRIVCLQKLGLRLKEAVGIGG